MKKMMLGTLALALITSGGLASSASASQEDLQDNYSIEISKDEDTKVEPHAFPAIVAGATYAGRAATSAWKAMPAGDRAMVTQAAQSMIGLGGVEKVENHDDTKDLEYIFDH